MASFGEVVKAVWKINQLPNEIKGLIEEFATLQGDQMWKSSIRACDMVTLLRFGLDEGQISRDLAQFYNISHQDHFSDKLVEELGPGFCYLEALDHRRRLDSILNLGIFPTLENFLVQCNYDAEDFAIVEVEMVEEVVIGHVAKRISQGEEENAVKWNYQCAKCLSMKMTSYWTKNCALEHKEGCIWSVDDIGRYLCNLQFMDIRLGGLFSIMNSKKTSPRSNHTRKSISNSNHHEEKQVLNFNKTIKGDGIEPDMTRDLFSVPKPDEVETMVDHLANHKAGDIFPYVAVVGNEEESKDSRLSRLRAYKSPYGKVNRPEMRINGVVLDEVEGTILVSHLKDFVDTDKLNKVQTKQNKRFKPIEEASFKKPYLLISRITGEYVPLMSSTSDYTDLYFTFEDGRLLEHQTIVQSNKLPTNQNGVFELSCDYCISVKDISQLSLKYFLSRPIMKDGFQWGSISLTIRMSESDTPYLIPKVEAMAIIRTPFTTLEEHEKDPDHADVVFTAGQVATIREMYKTGDIADVDEPKKERMKKNSYSKSNLRGDAKGETGPNHFLNDQNWSHMNNMRKPLLPEGEASVSAASGDEDDIDVKPTTKAEYERIQEKLREEFHRLNSAGSDTLGGDEEENAVHSQSNGRDSSEGSTIGSQKTPNKRKIRFEEPVLEPPNVENVYEFN